MTARGARRKPRAALPRRESTRLLLEGYADMLVPHFGECSLNLTGTYSEEYGYQHGLMLSRNVQKDLGRFLRQELQISDRARCCGVERHRTGRKILHYHAMIGGSWTAAEAKRVEVLWRLSGRGFCRAKVVTDRSGCVEYAAKHLLKSGDADALDWWFPMTGRRERRLRGASMPEVQIAPSKSREEMLARSRRKRDLRVDRDGEAICSDTRRESVGT